MIYKLEIKNGMCVKINGADFKKNKLKENKLKYAIYAFRLGEEIIYIGQTERGLYRCIDGLTCSKNQNVSYPWRSHRDIRDSELELLILGVGLPATMAINKSSREAVEADVASEVFIANKSWPRKLTSLKVHGGVTRSKSYKLAVTKILGEFEKNYWLKRVF